MLPWYWHSLPLEERTGAQIFEQLFLDQPLATLLESPYPSYLEQPALARYSLCTGGARRSYTPKVGQILPLLKSLLAGPKAETPKEFESLPFTGGWFGWLGYDLAWEIEQLPYLKSDSLPFPVAYWYEPAHFAIADHQEQILTIASSTKADLEQLITQLSNPSPIITNQHLVTSPLTLISSQQQYQQGVQQALKYIAAGDIFQANLSLRFQVSTPNTPWSIYQNLSQINPSPFASYWQTPWGAIISCSPERLVKLEKNRAETRPIAGTRRRGATPEQDQQLAQELTNNQKERAEHIMLVDLERNDLGRVCEWGSVEVEELLTIERYSHVMHLVSNIKGILQPDCDAVSLIKALFPGGTITGCPKVRCLEIIEEIEPVRRSLFYGSCGYLDQRGNLDLNILIRTLLFNNRQVWGQVGAGIVADSNPEQEWWESLQKAQAQLAALQVINPITKGAIS